MSSTEEMPKWDEALAALATDEYRRKNVPLGLDDFHALARQHNIRLDDIMETMFLLVIHGKWQYLDTTGQRQLLPQKTLDALYVQRRLSEDDLRAFDGSWLPAG